jgi:uncharacterized protein YfaS (alpha-2-macroglobulin family)
MNRLTTVAGALGVTLVLIACVARAASPEYLYGGPAGAYVPDRSIVGHYSSESGATVPLHVDVYSLSLDRVVAMGGIDRWSSVTLAVDAFGPRVAQAEGTRKDAEWTVQVPALPIGYYAAVASVGNLHRTTVFDVTTLGVVGNPLGATRSLFVVDLRTFLRHAGPTSYTIHAKSGATTVTADRSGLASFDVKPGDAQPVVVASTADGSSMVLTVQDWYDNRAASVDVGMVQTDRPIYRAGQTIDVRAVVRRGSIGGYTTPTGTRRVTVTAPDGTVIYDHDTSISAFGTVAATIPLAEKAALGEYRIGVGPQLSAYVSILAYKKPEYEIAFAPDKPFVIGGDTGSFTLSANYFFGRPAAGLHLHYVAYKQPHCWYGYGPFSSAISELYRMPNDCYKRTTIGRGDFVTDGQGRHSVSLGTEKTEYEQQVAIEADGRDASGRTVQVTGSLRVVPAAFALSLSSDEWFGQAGKAVHLTMTSRTYDDKPYPNASVAVEIVGSRWNRKSGKYGAYEQISRESRALQTGADGKLAFDWTPAAGASYAFSATAKDDRGNTARGYYYMWVLSEGENPWFQPGDQPTIVAQKDAFAPGERPRVFVTLPKPDRDILVIVSTDRFVSTRVVHVSGTNLALGLDAPRDAAQFGVKVELPNEDGVSAAEATIKVAPAPKALIVTIRPDKARYAPGERATFAIEARDVHGHPVRAELALGIVDQALYAVQEAPALDPMAVFYTPSAYFYPSFSWYRPNEGGLVAPGTTSDVYSVNAASGMLLKAAPRSSMSSAYAGSAVVIRSNFQDTAYWSPSIVTDANGQATISFDWPDNLTTWRADGLAVTRDTGLGTARATSLVTKDFLVRLETPRFLRAGDTSQIVGIGQGKADHPNVTMRLDTGAMGLGAFDAALHLDEYQSADTSWPVTANGTGIALLTLTGSDGVRTDGMQLPLPLLAATAAEHVRGAGSLPQDDTLSVTVPPGGYLGGGVTVTLTPSVVAGLVQNLRLLDVYPYYCTEQTMSAALPAIYVDKVLKSANLREPDDVSTSQIVANAIARLSQLQHGDGSWGWWENDSAHPFMTAYALYGLAEMRSGGYAVPDYIYDRGVSSLIAQLQANNTDTLRFWGGQQPDSEWNTRAYMLFALADAAPERAKGVVATWYSQTLAHAQQLNPYALAVLGLAERRLGNDEAARKLLAELDARAIDDGAFTFWRGDTWHYAWEDDPIETTAYALRLEAALAPDSPRVARTIAFLRAQERGGWWYTTKDTAASVYALAEAMHPDRSEFHPNETVRVLLNGRAVKTLHITTPILDAAAAEVVIPASDVRNGGTISFERTGTGSLYWASDAVRYVPPGTRSASDGDRSLFDRLFAVAPEFSIHREYDAGHPGPWRVGDEINVTVTVQTRETVQYVLVEDPFPAGAEHQDEQGHAADDAWSGVQLLDDHAAFFADRIEARYPLVLRYTLRVTTPGTYTAPAPTANAMYGPPVSAVGTGTTITVVP